MVSGKTASEVDFVVITYDMLVVVFGLGDLSSSYRRKHSSSTVNALF